MTVSAMHRSLPRQIKFSERRGAFLQPRNLIASCWCRRLRVMLALAKTDRDVVTQVHRGTPIHPAMLALVEPTDSRDANPSRKIPRTGSACDSRWSHGTACSLKISAH